MCDIVIEVSGGLLKSRGQQVPNGKWRGALKEPVIWKPHRQGHTGVDRTTRWVQADWFWLGMMTNIMWLVSTCEACQAAKHKISVPNKKRQ